MTSEHEIVESILGQMELRQPSSELDHRVSQIIGESTTVETHVPDQSLGLRSRNHSSGNLRLVTFGIVASLAGFMLGQLIDLNPQSRNQGQPTVNSAQRNSDQRNSTLTPVAFNPNAFALLHGHSTKPEFSNCKDCHSADGEILEKYRDWFYGDKELFKHHPKSDVSECSNCHTFDPSPKPAPEPEPHFQPVPGNLKHSNCSACHITGSSLPEPDIGSSPSLKEG